MPKGGARARSGPPPDPSALRRERDGGDWVSLPAAGRKGAPPKFPLVSPSKRESELWKLHWALPQAVEWERQRQFVEVALYVRKLAEAEVPGSMAAVATLVRQMGDSLGITQPGMRSNRWKIEDEEAAPAQSEPSGRSARDRFTVIAGDG